MDRTGRNRRKPADLSDDDGSNMTAPRKKKAKRDRDLVESCVETASSSSSSHRSVASASTFCANLSYEPTAPNAFNRCGKVISMRLTNFMCHSHLLMEFGPYINFLVGNNGSGKSAVITALALGLTSSARATNRASTMQKLIKNGQSSATIEITLSNVGVCPFKPEIYGPHVTVVRQIRQSSSTYDLRDAHGKSVCKKVDVIRRMLIRFGINTENPIFVLNQDAAREFLKQLEPSSNYKLLMKATQLDNCALSLAQCHEQRCNFNKELEHQEMKRNLLESQVDAEEEKLTVLRNKETFKIKLAEAKTALAWMAVTQFQDELTKFEKSLSLIQTKKANLEKSTSNKESTQSVLSQQLTEFEATRSKIADAYKAQEAKVRATKEIVQERAHDANRLQAHILNSVRRIKEEEHSLEACKKYVENYHADYSKVEQLKKEHANKLIVLKKEMAKNEGLVNEIREQQLDVKRELSAIQEKLEEMKNERVKLQKTKNSFQWELDSLTRNKANKISVYGEQAMQVLCTLRTQYSGSNKSNMPRGPIGQYISVPNSKYRDMVENELKSCLNSYIVNSDKERHSLRILLQNKYPGGNIPTIITSAFSDRVYDVSKYKVRATTANTSVLIDEISCKDPVVMNYLIDAFRIETVLVTESKDIAEFLTSESENVPPNLSRVLVSNLGLEYLPSPNYAVYSNRIAPARYITNVDERIQQLKNEQRNLQERELPLEANYEQNKQKLDSAFREVKNKKSIIDRYNEENQRAMQQIIDIENFEYQELPQYDRLKTSLTESTEKIQKFKKEREELQAKLTEIQKGKVKAEADETAEANTLKKINNQVEILEAEYQKVESKIRSIDLHYEENSRNLKKTVELEREFISKKKAMEGDLAKAREEAEKLGDFVNMNQTEEEIRNQIGSYKSKIKQLDKTTYNAEEVERELDVLRNNLNTQANQTRTIESVVKKLRMAYHQRAQLFQRSRHHYFTMVQFQFEQALAMRNFRVCFERSDREKTWSINVFPPSGNETSNTRSLSGGERSFTTVSLLKGLWSTSDHPFYFLDEYDVFTDEVNRKFITQILINEGLDCKNRQYCFLTPQDTEVAASNFITVHKLEPPER